MNQFPNQQTIKTGNTFRNAGGSNKKEVDFLLSRVKKAIKIINNSATSVYHFSNHTGNTFSSCIDEISKCKESSFDFEKVFGITPSDAKALMPILPTKIFDVCIENSKKGHSQKYAMNKELGILGEQDNPELWNKIISQEVLDARIRYALKNNGKILIVGGGHGTEVDILVEKYGKGIVKHIWFNDNIISFTNEVKRKYNKINILKGDLLSLIIKMMIRLGLVQQLRI